MLADVFAEDLAGENMASISAAFALHRRRSARFPAPAHILALLPECRAAPPALPPKASGPRTKGAGRLAHRALKGDMEAKAILERLVAEARGRAR